MPDRRVHRGPHPEDATLFAPDQHARLRQAVADFSWLLTRGYAEKSALKLVGDHFLLDARQRIAVMRCSCSDLARLSRLSRRASAPELQGNLHIDGYNILTTAEAALAGGVLIVGRDGCIRDMASIHGSYRKVEETRPAINLIGEVLRELPFRACVWYLDSPVSNSGRLKAILTQVAFEHGWSWRVEIVADPDAVLRQSDEVITTADSVVLDRCRRWFDLAGPVVARVAGAWVVDLGGSGN